MNTNRYVPTFGLLNKLSSRNVASHNYLGVYYHQIKAGNLAASAVVRASGRIKRGERERCAESERKNLEK